METHGIRIGRVAHIPTAAEYERQGYEPNWGTAYAPGADAVVVEESLTVLDELARI